MDIPPGIPSHLANSLEKKKAELLLIESVSSIILTSKFLGMKPAPIPWIECEPASLPLITAESSGSTAIIFISLFFSFKKEPTPDIVPPVPTPDIKLLILTDH